MDEVKRVIYSAPFLDGGTKIHKQTFDTQMEKIKDILGFSDAEFLYAQLALVLFLLVFAFAFGVFVSKIYLMISVSSRGKRQGDRKWVITVNYTEQKSWSTGGVFERLMKRKKPTTTTLRVSEQRVEENDQFCFSFDSSPPFLSIDDFQASICKKPFC